MGKAKILLQLDSDAQPSVFDAVVAVDAGVERLLRHGGVEPTQVADLVHGLMFTRGPADLHGSAIFIGGRDVAAGEALLQSVTRCFFGPMRVSVLFDANGANTTAAAAVIAAGRHVDLSRATVAVMAATGPVGLRIVRLMARLGATVRVASRRRDRAEDACRRVREAVPEARLEPWGTEEAGSVAAILSGAAVVISAGAAGVPLVEASELQASTTMKVAIDLNAVPPSGIVGIEPFDKAVHRSGRVDYGAIGVGATKMKIHKAALRRLFESNDQVLDAEAILELGQELESAAG